MAKAKTVYFCQNCGTESPKWVGKCPACSEWNTYVEETVQKDKSSAGYVSSKIGSSKPIAIKEVEASKEPRIIVPDQELNRVLGGG
ncbi:MAG: DNA repair protein RadA/Sms, partial [Marivirga sp.]